MTFDVIAGMYGVLRAFELIIFIAFALFIPCCLLSVGFDSKDGRLIIAFFIYVAIEAFILGGIVP